MGRVRNKKTRQKQRGQLKVSRALRVGMIRLQSRAPRRGLRLLNRIAGGRLRAAVRARLLGLLGDHELRRGLNQRAIAIYTKALEFAGSDSKLLFRLNGAVVRALLADGLPEEASIRAQAFLRETESREIEYAACIAKLDADLRNSDCVEVPERPLRVSVVALRLARCFLAAGENATGQALLQRCLDASPNGAVRARISLGHLALRSGNWDEAMARGEEALLIAKGSAKAIEAWPLLISARHGAGVTGLTHAHVSCLDQAIPSVRSRSTLEIVRCLRTYDDPAWIEIAMDWLRRDAAAFPKVAAEMRKLLLSEIAIDPEALVLDRIGLACDLLATESLGPKEFLFGARQAVKGHMQQGEAPPFEHVLKMAADRFGAGFVPTVRHSMALASAECGRPEIAESLLEQNRIQLKRAHRYRAKAIWRLGTLAEARSAYDTAAARYREFYEIKTVPLHLRQQALLRFVRMLTQAQQVSEIDAAVPVLNEAVDRLTSAEQLLDLARKLVACAAPLPSIGRRAFEKGVARAKEEMAAADKPQRVSSLLFKLARRQSELGFDDAVVTMWEGLAEDRIRWLKSASGDFWNYLDFVYRSYYVVGRSDAAIALAEEHLTEPGTPPEAFVALGVVHGQHLICQKGLVREGLQWLHRVAAESLYVPAAASAYYWLSLESVRDGDRSFVADYTWKMRRSVGVNPGLVRHQQHLLAADLLDGGGDVGAIIGRYPFANRSRVDAVRRAIEDDLAILGGGSAW